MNDLPAPFRIPILLLGMLSLVAGVLAGLARLAWTVPPVAASVSALHGALMISAFFGTVISLERAVAIGRSWAYLAPAAAGGSGIVLLSGLSPGSAMLLAGLASAVMLTASIRVMHRHFAPFTIVLAIGSACWLIGSLAWLLSGWVEPAIPWWLSFLVLTIAGERLELSRFHPTPKAAQMVFYLIVGVILFGNLVGFWASATGLPIFAGGLLALALWLLRFDIAWRNARLTGLPKFVAICLLGGYVWLAFAGALGVAGAFTVGHPWRDSALHAVGLGFVFAMVFGHAPIIFPAITRLKIPFHRAFYFPLLLLHASLLVRVVGTLTDDFIWRREGALANALTLLVFIAVLLGRLLKGRNLAPRKTATLKELEDGLRC